MRSVPHLFSLAMVTLLSACGGGGADAPPTTGKATPTLTGVVAVGAPITGGTLRVLDATGAVVAANVTIDAQGNYPPIALSGTGPYRIEACGYAGGRYTCLYSLASGPGVANATPLTSAALLLAAGQSPAALMTGAAPSLTPAAVTAAQEQLRAGLAPVLADAGLSPAFDLIGGALTAGSRTGYDRVLDAVGVHTGQDGQPFVQITARLGSGQLYLQPGSTSGTVQMASGAGSLSLSGIEGLFLQMNTAMASAAACAHPTSGLHTLIAPDTRLSFGSQMVEGAAAVAEVMCGYLANGEDGAPLWGFRLMSPTLGRCDLSAGQGGAVCRVSFVLVSPQGDMLPVGSGMGVKQVAGSWKFYGLVHGIELNASAKVQRDRRIDGASSVDSYTRALAFEVAAQPGLACARVSQRNSQGAPAVVGYYKPHGGQRLSLWTDGEGGQTPSLDPTQGATRSGDDTWIPLPDGAEGDAVIRNFYRGGRSVTIALFSDAACTQPFEVRGRSEFEVDVDGVPPVWSAMPGQPWAELDDASKAALRSFALSAGGSATFQAGWTFPRGPLGVDGVTFCGNRSACGAGQAGRLAERDLRPGTTSTSLLVQAGAAVAADAAKMLALYGRTGDGVDVQSNFTSCPSVPVGEPCR